MRLPENPFLKIGEFLVERWNFGGKSAQDKELSQEIISLATGKKDAVKQHYAGKIADTLLVFTVMAVASLVLFLMTGTGSQVLENGWLQRPGYGMGDREEELAVRIEGETETEQLSVIVQEQKLTGQQVEELLEKAKQELERTIIGENPSPDEVRMDLNFPVSMQEGRVAVGWMTFPYGLIGDDGKIQGDPEEEGSIVEIRATLSCQGQELVYETAVCVYPPVLSESQRLWKSLHQEMQQADESTASQEILTLPETVEGKQVTWSRQGEQAALLFLALTLILPLCVYLQKDQKVHEKAKERRLQLELDYPEVMWKMTLLLGAGLTIRGAFSRIASEYRKENTGSIRYAYEEMIYTCREMKSGVAESTAYENFGRRCGLPKYIKLGSLLSQNLKKGSRGLVSLLEKEAESSMEERKNMARKLGEQAGTKLMFPMILMFGVVLIVLIVPAFLSF